MSKLIVISNRVPSAGSKEAGGLAVALGQVLAERGGTWIGWSGSITEKPQVHHRVEGNIRYRTVDFEQADYDGFYTGYCNSTLWPLCHYRMDLCQFSPEMWEAYDRVSQIFADQVMAVAKRGDIVWAHDYHMLLLGAQLRARKMEHKLGFFLHIPFPVPEVFSALPHHQDIIKGLTAYDVIGFQTETDVQSFMRCLVQMGENPIINQVDEGIYEITAYGRTFKAGKFSISIDTQELMLAADRSAIDPQIVELKQGLGTMPLMIGVDRLDYTKGLMERLNAYQLFLERWPEYRGNVSYVQITPPSRTDVKDYEKMREQLESFAARVNGTNAEINWVPIRYINKSFSRDELAGFYRASRVGLVTPLRDGMNLVAKEYVASQNPDDPGVLLLSKFAGAADELQVGALMVNPYNAQETAEQIHRALTMSVEERKERYQSMIAVLSRHDIFLWTKRFLSCLEGKKTGSVIRFPGEHVRKFGRNLPALSELIEFLSMAD